MAYRRGGIYLANFNPSKGTEAGKIRPCLVVQSNLLTNAGHPSTTILPLTSQLIEDAAPLRFRIGARDELQADSDVMLDQVRTIDNQRFCSDLLTTLTNIELTTVETYWRLILDLD